MSELAAIGLLIVAIFFGLVMLGKAKGNPDPKSMSVDAINSRINSEQRWVEKYLALPMSNQIGEAINKQYRGKKIFILELRVELLTRQIAQTGQREEETMAPSFRKIIELMKSGVPENEAVALVKEELKNSEAR
ncbi:hypothetical protein [Pseudomonas sp. TWR3-1-1]|uniref:hypothetical protein n=1 Tax=Pseudomonas sp. TWR3-1-1 TaxID=2804633 RepID=UPI003CE78E74